MFIIKALSAPQFSGSNPEVETIKKRVKQQATRLSRQFTQDGRPVYPGLRNSVKKQGFVEQRVKMVKALKSGQAQLVPDVKPDGRHNFDGECEFCGNRVGNECVKPEPPYIQSRV
ncbi:MAG: hypothetical protein R6X11_00390 [Desulfonatronovibrio sp.]